MNTIPLFFFSTVVLLAGYFQYAEANHPEDKNICAGKCISGVQNTQSSVSGIEFSMISRDLNVRDSHCDYDKSVATQWMRFDDGTWIETGITEGFYDPDDDVSNECLDTPTTYYAICKDFDVINKRCNDYFERKYTENIPVNSELDFKIEKNDSTNNWSVFLDTDQPVASFPDLIDSTVLQTDIGFETNIPVYILPTLTNTPMYDIQAKVGNFYGDWNDLSPSSLSLPIVYILVYLQ